MNTTKFKVGQTVFVTRADRDGITLMPELVCIVIGKTTTRLDVTLKGPHFRVFNNLIEMVINKGYALYDSKVTAMELDEEYEWRVNNFKTAMKFLIQHTDHIKKLSFDLKAPMMVGKMISEEWASRGPKTSIPELIKDYEDIIQEFCNISDKETKR